MQPRAPLLLLVGLVLACTTTPGDDPTASESGTTAPATTSGASAGSSGSSGAAGSSGAGEATTQPDDPTTASTDEDSSGGPGTTGGPAVSFMTVYEQIVLTKGCNAGYCHGGGAGGLEMTDEATTYANLVDVAGTTMQCGQSTRVVPGEPDLSILWYRVRPAALDAGDPCAQDGKMPKGMPPLSDAEAQLVHDWIAGGALE